MGRKDSWDKVGDAAARMLDWRAYLPEEKAGIQERVEELDARKKSWHGLIVPAEGEVKKWVVERLTVPQLWVISGLCALKWLSGMSLIVSIFWAMPLVAYGFICWKQRHSSGDWLIAGFVVIGIGLLLSAPGVMAVMGAH